MIKENSILELNYDQLYYSFVKKNKNFPYRQFSISHIHNKKQALKPVQLKDNIYTVSYKNGNSEMKLKQNKFYNFYQNKRSAVHVIPQSYVNNPNTLLLFQQILYAFLDDIISSPQRIYFWANLIDSYCQSFNYKLYQIQELENISQWDVFFTILQRFLDHPHRSHIDIFFSLIIHFSNNLKNIST